MLVAFEKELSQEAWGCATAGPGQVRSRACQNRAPFTVLQVLHKQCETIAAVLQQDLSQGVRGQGDLWDISFRGRKATVKPVPWALAKTQGDDMANKANLIIISFPLA